MYLPTFTAYVKSCSAKSSFQQSQSQTQNNTSFVPKSPEEVEAQQRRLHRHLMKELNREYLTYGARVLVNLVPALKGCKLKKSKRNDPRSLRSYAFLIHDEAQNTEFQQYFMHVKLYYSIEITNDGRLFRIRPGKSEALAIAKTHANSTVKLCQALEDHPAGLYQAGDLLVRKRKSAVTTAEAAIHQQYQLEQEAKHIPFLLKGYVGIASPYVIDESTVELGRFQLTVIPPETRSKVPELPARYRSFKDSLIMPLAPGYDLFEYLNAFPNTSVVHTKTPIPYLEYRLRNHLRLCLCAILVSFANFRLQQPDNPLIHLDIKLENIMLHIETEGHVVPKVQATLIDAEFTRPLSDVIIPWRGTPGYMAPEMYGDGLSSFPNITLSVKLDCYALGVTLLLLCYPALYNHLPWLSLHMHNMKKRPWAHYYHHFTTHAINTNAFSFDGHHLCYKGYRLEPHIDMEAHDYLDFIDAVKAILPLVHFDPNDRPLDIDVLTAEFLPELHDLFENQPELKREPAYQALQTHLSNERKRHRHSHCQVI